MLRGTGRKVIASALLVLAVSAAAGRLLLETPLPSPEDINKTASDVEIVPAAARQQALDLAAAILNGEDSRVAAFKAMGEALYIGNCQQGKVYPGAVVPAAFKVYADFVEAVIENSECAASLDVDTILQDAFFNGTISPSTSETAADSAPETLPTTEEIAAFVPGEASSDAPTAAESIALAFIFGGSAATDAVKAVASALDDAECVDGPVGTTFLPAVDEAIANYIVQSTYDYSQCKLEGRSFSLRDFAEILQVAKLIRTILFG